MKLFILIGASVILGFFFFIYELNETDSKAEIYWMQFSAAHHCKVKTQYVLNPDIWACDGFEVKHQR
jgi:hypothetical protein